MTLAAAIYKGVKQHTSYSVRYIHVYSPVAYGLHLRSRFINYKLVQHTDIPPATNKHTNNHNSRRENRCFVRFVRDKYFWIINNTCELLDKRKYFNTTIFVNHSFRKTFWAPSPYFENKWRPRYPIYSYHHRGRHLHRTIKCIFNKKTNFLPTDIAITTHQTFRKSTRVDYNTGLLLKCWEHSFVMSVNYEIV